MMSVAASLALMSAMGALGIALLYRFARHLTPLERWAYGAPLGMVIGSLLLVPVATVLGLGTESVALVGAACAVVAGVSWLTLRERRPISVAGAATGIPDPADLEPTPGDGATTTLRSFWLTVQRFGLLPILVLGAFATRWALFWRDALTQATQGLYAGHVNLWGDWPVHLGIVSSFAYGANFPPAHPRFDGHAFAYHYLSDLTAAAMVPLGMTPGGALALHSYVGSVLVAAGLFAFARRMTGDRTAASLTLVLFFLGGGLGWLVTAGAMEQSRDVLGPIATMAWDRTVKREFNLQFVNMFFGFVASQRAFLYGLPLAFAILSTLLVAVRRADVRLFIVAGAIAGLLPLAHLGTLLALAIVTPVLFLMFPSRAWLAFFAVWMAVAVPQLLTQLGGSAGALSALRLQLGWVSSPDAWPWFWIKNLGWFAPLVIAGLLTRHLVPERARRFLVAFMVLFVAANVAVFQPWDWDNHKLLVYWFVAVSIVVAALLARIWRRLPEIGPRMLVLGVILSMTASGMLEDVGTFLGQSRYRMLAPDQLALADQIRATTDPDALFVVGMENHDPVAMLTGRRIYMGDDNWLWTEGIPFEARRDEVRGIYRYDPGTEAVLAERGIDFVVIGPHERDALGADEGAFRERFPVLTKAGDWTVYDVRGAAP
jgi:hypothetical protein